MKSNFIYNISAIVLNKISKYLVKRRLILNNNTVFGKILNRIRVYNYLVDIISSITKYLAIIRF